MGKGAG